MSSFLYWLQIVVAILLVLSILLQHKSAGLSATFGGGGSAYSGKRGVDRVLSNSTVILAIIFFAAAIAALFVN